MCGLVFSPSSFSISSSFFLGLHFKPFFTPLGHASLKDSRKEKRVLGLLQPRAISQSGVWKGKCWACGKKFEVSMRRGVDSAKDERRGKGTVLLIDFLQGYLSLFLWGNSVNKFEATSLLWPMGDSNPRPLRYQHSALTY